MTFFSIYTTDSLDSVEKKLIIKVEIVSRASNGEISLVLRMLDGMLEKLLKAQTANWKMT